MDRDYSSRSSQYAPRSRLLPAGGEGFELSTAELDKVATGSYLLPMRVVGLKVLKNKLSEFVRLAARGETVLVTDRDEVVAELVPPRKDRSPRVADAVLADAVRQGWITPPTIPSEGLPPRSPVTEWTKLQIEINRDREDR